jgi:hypothetical protein
MAGHMDDGYPATAKHAPAYTPTAELMNLPFLAAEKVGYSGAEYTLAKRGNALRPKGAGCVVVAALDRAGRCSNR